MTRCDPLKPNELYQVHAGGGTVGWRAFTVEANGDIVLGQGSCSSPQVHDLADVARVPLTRRRVALFWKAHL
jgi:hypothetical protein